MGAVKMPTRWLLAGALLVVALAGYPTAFGQGSGLSSQTQAEADRKSAGCLGCHTQTDRRSMHSAESVRLGCTDCHGGDATVPAPARGTREYERATQRAHVRPRHPERW